MKILCLKHAFSYIVYMAQKQSQNHLLLAITSCFSSCCCYFNLTTKTSHNHVSSRITRVHFWKKKKKHPEKPPNHNNNKTPQQTNPTTKTKLPLPSQFLNCVHTLQNLVQGIRPSWDPPLVGPEQNKLNSVMFRKLLSKAERKVLIALSSECLFTPLSCWTKKEKKWKATVFSQLVQGELAKFPSGEVHCIRMTKCI